MDNFQIVLINTDFKTNFKIKRPVLHKILINKYNLFSKYEPCIYPGVDTKFFWNNIYKNDGICHCAVKCTGKGFGNGEGDCKKVTIAAFQSGSVIITGARNMSQVIDSYNFINSVFSENYNNIRKILPHFVIEDEIKDKRKKNKKTYYIRKDLVKNRYSD